ncbi:11525_t:CDS:1 [Scutellospora calospora]|uniref:11525_t:CDS:1 n=1 Tax=Scutellospora calospora TaxID=85575 RepID=A0ACA9KCE3_9GLOM|nr:11525_t:CDS:1 [Scutellospora calospora]
MSQQSNTQKNRAMIRSELQDDQISKNLFYVTKKFDLPIKRLHPQSHYPAYREQRGSCVWCRFINMSEQGKHNKNSPQSQVWCTICNVPLCLNKQRPDCFIEYHEHK